MQDLFSAEQKILDEAVLYSAELKKGADFEPDKFNKIVKEYARLLKQLRRVTKISDGTAGALNKNRQDLLSKVHYDALTGVYNRRFLEENLRRVLKSISRSGGCLSVMMLDIDFFKKYNDTYGHSKGDDCLKEVAETITGCLMRADDFAARYGGEEFAVILPDTDESGARVMANKIIESIRNLNIPHEKNEAAGCVTISVGLTTSVVKHTHNSLDYIKHADEALYRSKHNGRNQYTYIDFKEGL